MSILAQHKYPLSPKHDVYTCLSPCLRTRVYCLATTTTTTTTKPRPNLDQLVIEPQLIPSQTLVTSPHSRPILNDPSLRSTWAHRAWVASGCTTVMISLAKSIMGAAESHMWLEPILASLVGYILADLGFGVYHWGIDNYGSAQLQFFVPK